MSRITSFLTRANRKRAISTLATAALAFSSVCYAALPTQPTGVPTTGSYMENMRDYIGMGIGLVALVLAGYAFLAVSGGAISKFSEWRAGKAELGDLKMVFIVGGLLLLVVIYLVTEAVQVIPSSGSFVGG